jgi:hypothetical protein
METNNEEETNKIKEKAKIFFENKVVVHINILNTSLFYNGLIKKIKPGYLILIDEVRGWLPFFYNEIYAINPREEKKSGI